MTALQIFASYEAKDTEFATQLITDLHNDGVEVITNNVGLEDMAFEQFLSEELSQCQYLIVVQTLEALQSPRVRAIVDNALKQVQAGQMTGVLRVIAPAQDGAGTQAVPLRWATTPEFDASQDYQKALTRLRLHLGVGNNEVYQDAPPAPPATPIPPTDLPEPKGTENKSLFGNWVLASPLRLLHSGFGISSKFPVATALQAERSAGEDRPLRALQYPHKQLRRQLFFLSLAMTLILIATSVTVFIYRSSAPTATVSSTPTVAPTPTSLTNLDDTANQWTVLPDQAGATLANAPAPKEVTTPSIDGSALQIPFTGQGCLVYQTLPAADNAKTFEMDLSFYVTSASSITGIAFTAGKLVNTQWWEWALQWSNSPGGGSWRMWDGNTWRDTQVRQNISDNTWHSLQLKGDIVNRQVHYISFSYDQVSHNLDQTFAPGSKSSNNQLAIFFELDGVPGQSYQVDIDKIKLQYS